jgi:hypothetical protein
MATPNTCVYPGYGNTACREGFIDSNDERYQRYQRAIDDNDRATMAQLLFARLLPADFNSN